MIQDSFNRLSYVSLRPLSKGMDLDSPPHLIEIGAFLRLENVNVRRGGLERRSGYGSFYDGLPALDWKVYGSPMWYDENGNPVPILFTKKHVWKIDEGPTLTLLSKTLFSGLSGTITAAGGSDPSLYVMTDGASTDFSSVNAGDTIWLGGTSTGEPYEIVDTDVASHTLTFRNHLSGSTPSGTSYDVVEGFRRVPDWTILRVFEGNTYLVWTDNSSRPLRKYDTATGVTDLETGTPAVTMKEIDTVTAFGGRLWVAGLNESSRDERFRIRWTTVTDQLSFPASQYLDVPVRRFGISRLLPLGNLLVAYFKDGIYFGRPTNIVNLPYDFTPYDTGNIGLVGPRAVAAWLDAHWFVGQDDIYSFSASRALERIGTKVVRETIRNPDIDLSQTIVTPDPVNERIVFQFFSRGSGKMSRLWAFYYKTAAWATEPFSSGDGYFYGRTVNATSWSDATGTWDTSDYFVAWYTFRPTVEAESVFRSEAGRIRMYLEGKENDVSGSTDVAIPVTIESGDFDFQKPNVLKSITQLSVKLEKAVRGGTLEFNVWGSVNRSQDEKLLGTLRIEEGQDEGKVDFRSVGSLFRFRLVSSSVVQPWTLNEVVLVASEVGRESVFL